MRLLPGEYIQGLRRLDKAYRSQLQQLVGEYKLTPGEMAVLLFLHNNAPELDTASDIVRCRDLSKALVARSVESLRQKGYVTLSRDEHDRRVIHLALSEKSRPISREIERRQSLLWSRLGEGIEPEALNAALETLSRLIHNAQNNLTGEDTHADK